MAPFVIRLYLLKFQFFIQNIFTFWMMNFISTKCCRQLIGIEARNKKQIARFIDRLTSRSTCRPSNLAIGPQPSKEKDRQHPWQRRGVTDSRAQVIDLLSPHYWIARTFYLLLSPRRSTIHTQMANMCQWRNVGYSTWSSRWRNDNSFVQHERRISFLYFFQLLFFSSHSIAHMTSSISSDLFPPRCFSN